MIKIITTATALVLALGLGIALWFSGLSTAPAWLLTTAVVAILIATLLNSRVGRVIAVLGAVMLLAWGVASFNNGNHKVAAEHGATSTTATTTTIPVSCPYGEPVRPADNPQHRVNPNGYGATNGEEAKAESIEEAKVNPQYVASYMMDYNRQIEGASKDYIDATSLYQNGCWTHEGLVLSAKVQGLLETAESVVIRELTPEEAAKARNTGVVDGKVTKNANPGITGDLRVVVVKHRDGSMTVFLYRCKNLVASWEIPAPVGPTDEQPPTTTVPGTTPGTTPTTAPPTTALVKKDPRQSSGSTGEAPVGGGKNQDPGTGSYTPPSDVQRPPAAPRQNPTPPTAPPAPSTTKAPAPTTTHVPPVSSTPPIEAADPAPEKPATGTSCAPGRPSC